MTRQRLVLANPDAVAEAGFQAIRDELEVPFEYPADALAEAETAAATGPRPPTPGLAEYADRRDVELVSIDPAGSRDLDQAFGATPHGDGFRVFYAIADVAAFVRPGGALDSATRDRGVTLYSPDVRTPLHPEAISEDAASLLPDRERPALLWTIDLDLDGAVSSAHVERSVVRSREMLSYAMAQERIDDGHHDTLQLLRAIGNARLGQEVARDAVSLQLPTQEVHCRDGGYRLGYDRSHPVEKWNAQISLVTGIVAAGMQLDGSVGLLRTLPPADSATIDVLRTTAKGLGIDWPDDETYASRLRRLDPNVPAEMALMAQGLRTLRGAGYLAFRDHPDESHEHAAIASAYSHVTAPLRRICDRFSNEILLALSADLEPPAWAVEALEELPSIMGRSSQRDRALERETVDYMETLVLSDRIGTEFSAVVTDVDDDDVRLVLDEPAVISRARGLRASLGERLRVRLVDADPDTRRLTFEAA